MKSTLILFGLFFSITSGFSQNIDTTMHYGRREGKDKTEIIGEIILEKEGHCYFIVNRDTLGKDGTIVQGEDVDLNYLIDYSQKPIAIDFYSYITGKPIDSTKAFKGIIEFTNKDKLKIRLSFAPNSERPKDFLPTNNINSEGIIVLERVN